jgi:hypothetical protein
MARWGAATEHTKELQAAMGARATYDGHEGRALWRFVARLTSAVLRAFV